MRKLLDNGNGQGLNKGRTKQVTNLFATFLSKCSLKIHK